jgi:hypothetical protein
MKLTIRDLKNIIRETYSEVLNEVKKKKKKWIQDVMQEPGSLSKELGIPEEENIPLSRIQDEIKKLKDKRESEGKLSASDLSLLRKLYLARTLKTKIGRRKN